MSAVHTDGTFWYFWDETWSARHGPYYTEAYAFEAYWRYCEYLG